MVPRRCARTRLPLCIATTQPDRRRYPKRFGATRSEEAQKELQSTDFDPLDLIDISFDALFVLSRETDQRFADGTPM